MSAFTSPLLAAAVNNEIVTEWAGGPKPEITRIYNRWAEIAILGCTALYHVHGTANVSVGDYDPTFGLIHPSDDYDSPVDVEGEPL